MNISLSTLRTDHSPALGTAVGEDGLLHEKLTAGQRLAYLSLRRRPIPAQQSDLLGDFFFWEEYETALFATTSCSGGSSRDDLPRQEERWVNGIVLDSESRAIGAPLSINVGETIEGIAIGAIKCSFHWRDATNGGEQFMWRGRWGCMAGRSREEVEKAVGPDGDKLFAYIHFAPVSID